MRISKKQLILILALIVISLSLYNFALARELENKYPKLPGLPQLTSNTTLPDLLAYLYGFFIFISGLIAFGSFVYAGFLFMTSGANPGLRAEAQKRIRNALSGLALLFGIYLILNTINPELIQLYTPGEGPQGMGPVTLQSPKPLSGQSVNLETLRYGGVIVYESADLTGGASYGSNKSEVIFHDVVNFANASYIDASNAASGIRILGNCTVKLFKQDGSQNGPAVPVNASVVLNSGGYTDNNTEKLDFVRKDCMGHSVMTYESIDYNLTVGIMADPLKLGQGLSLFLDSDLDLRGNDFVTSGEVNDNIRSIRFSHDAPINNDAFTVKLCDNLGPKEPCATAANSSSTLSRAVLGKVSTITLDSGENRQAGVVLYEHPNFHPGRHEVFIASDKAMDNGSFVQHDKVSSLKIIGKYRVTLYENNNYSGNWVQFDNTIPENPQYTVDYDVNNGEPEHDGEKNELLPEENKSGGILKIPDLRDEKYCIKYSNASLEKCVEIFDNRINSIKIEIPERIFNAQQLGSCTPLDNFCLL